MIILFFSSHALRMYHAHWAGRGNLHSLIYQCQLLKYKIVCLVIVTYLLT